MPSRRRYKRSSRRSKPYSRRYGRKRYQRTKKVRRAKKNYKKNIITIPRPVAATAAFVKLKTISPWVVFAPATFNSVTSVVNMPNLVNGTTLWTNPQPVGFDQWSAMFQRYTVLGFKITAEILSNSATIMGSFTLLPSISTLTQIRTAMDGAGSLGSGQNNAALAQPLAVTRSYTQKDGSRSAIKIKKYISMKTLFPDSDVTDDPDFSGTTSTFTSGETAPVANAWMYLITTQYVQSAGNCNVRFWITYYTKFSGPVVFGAS